MTAKRNPAPVRAGGRASEAVLLRGDASEDNLPPAASQRPTRVGFDAALFPVLADRWPDLAGQSRKGRDRPVLRLSRNWALLADRNQWIVAKWTGPRGQNVRTQGRWKPLGYVGSTKTVLARVSRELGAVVTPEAQAVLDAWPERFLDWRAAVEAVQATGLHL